MSTTEGPPHGWADVQVVQRMLGDKSATMVPDLYGHLSPDRLDTVADAMDAASMAAPEARLRL